MGSPIQHWGWKDQEASFLQASFSCSQEKRQRFPCRLCPSILLCAWQAWPRFPSSTQGLGGGTWIGRNLDAGEVL